MKNASLILNIILLLAVGYLYIAHFSGGKRSTEETPVALEAKSPDIVFVYADSVLNSFQDFKEKETALNKRLQEADAQFQTKGRALERDIQAIQQKIQQGLLAPNQIATEEQRIAQRQQTLLQERDRVTMELQEELQKLNEELQATVKGVLLDLQREKGYDYILSYGPGTGVLMVNDSLDVTRLLVERLNAAQPPAGQ